MSKNSGPSHMSPNTLLPLLLFLIFNPFAHSISFNFSSFEPYSTQKTIVYEGDASNVDGNIQLNRDGFTWRVGRATFVDHVPLYNSTTESLTDFNTHFTFTIEPYVPYTYGEGLTFFLAPPDFQLPPNSAAGFLGLCNTSTYQTPHQNSFVAVEFDTKVNEWDPPVEHVGIIANSLTSVAHVNWNSSLHREDIANAWIRYDGRTKNLSVSLTYGDDSGFNNGSYNLSYHVDLMQFLPQSVMVGFTGATGIDTEKHTIHSWEFSSTLAIEANHVPTAKKKARKPFKWVVAPSILVGILVAGVCIGWVMLVIKSRKKKTTQRQDAERRTNLTSMNGAFERGAGPRRFSYEALVLATNNFSDENKLGQGGFGDVYKGFLIDLDMTVAVKKVSRESTQGKRAYMTEVKIIGQLRHRNLVQLIGWCHDQEELLVLLVYEFMSNGSLDSHLFGKRHPLNWVARYKIVTGLASAILYLHEEWEQCVLHRDIKSSNVMLDFGFNAKLGDFGLARLMDHELGAQTTTMAGTLGYLAPECVVNGRASKESDVYSFGVVALEIACGRKPMEAMEDKQIVRLLDWVWELHGNGRLLKAADKRLGSEYDAGEMECLIMVGLWCAQPDPNLRPSIRQAMRVLNQEEEMPDLRNGAI